MLNRLRSLVRALVHRREFEHGMAEELRFHVDTFAADLGRGGMSKEEAARQARAAFGSVATVREECQQARGLRFFDWLRQDVRYALRILARTPSFTAALVLSLGLGIGATTAVFSLVDAVLLRSLPVMRPGELFFLAHGEGDAPGTNSNYPLFERYRSLPVFAGVTAFRAETLQVGTGDGSVELVPGQFVSGSYHAVIGTPMALGRGFASESDRPTSDDGIAVISDAFWTRRFGRSPDVLGHTLRVGGRQVTIVGVTATGFRGLVPGTSIDITLPLSMYVLDDPTFLTAFDGFTSMPIVARLRQGTPEPQALAAADGVLQQFMQEPAVAWARGEAFSRARLVPAGLGDHGLRRQYATPLLVSMAMAALVLLIASANAANLLLARSSARAREVALRLCVGAGRGRLIRQFLTESVIVALASGAAGLLCAYWGTAAIVALFSVWQQPLVLDVAVNARVFAFASLISLATGLVFGLVPALESARVDLAPTLKGNDGQRRTHGPGLVSHGLIVAQVALCVVVLTVAALLVQSVRNLKTQPTGFDAARVLLFDLSCATTVQPATQCGSLVRQLLDRLTNLPGVTSVAVSTMTPTNTEGRFRGLALVGKPLTPEASGVFENVVSPRYFDTLGVPLLRGRDFTVHDADPDRRVAIVNDRTARYIFGDEEAIGRTIAWGSTPNEPIEIIGVVGDTKQNSLREDAPRMVYTPLSPQGGQIAIKMGGVPLTVVPAVRDQAHQVSRDLLVARVRTMEDQIDSALVSERALMLLTTAFAIVAAILTCIGLYGVMSFQVARRTREIGIRLALGELPQSVLAGVLRRAMRVSVAGLAVGLVCAILATRLVSAFLYGLSPQDPLTLAAVALGLLATALLAGWLPARRAARIDPLLAIRSE